MAKIRPNDLLIFHVLRPVNGIVAVGRVTSEVYKDNSNVWGKNRYPIRVRIEFLSDQLRSTNNPIPLDALYGNDPHSEFAISPLLKNIWLAPVSVKQYENIKRVFSQDHTGQIT